MTHRSAAWGIAVGGCVVLAAVAAVGVAVAQSVGLGPRIRFEKSTHDFGRLRPDQKVTYDWVFRNEGDAPLEIGFTRSTCGCAASVVEDEQVPPGGSGTLRVSFDPAGQQGSVRKTLLVVSNDPIRPHVRLTLRADVEFVESAQGPEGHPLITGQSLLMGECAGCHAAPARDKSGEALWDAVCSMCHGSDGQGSAGKAPSLRSSDYLATRSDDDLHLAITYGTANPRMPGFSNLMGGPLDESQIRSLVALIREWGPASGAPPGDRGDSQP